MLQDWDTFEKLPLEDQTNMIEGVVIKAHMKGASGNLTFVKALAKDERFAVWCRKPEVAHYTSGLSTEWAESVAHAWKCLGSDDVPDIVVGPCMCPNCVAAREALRKTAN
jgi:hypothetical protein